MTEHRISLRAPTEDDRDTFVRLFGDPEFMVFHSHGAMHLDAANARFDRMLRMADELHCSKRPVVERATGELVGYAGFDVMEFEGAQWLELGYRLIRSARGKGYATEACATILAQASLLFGGEVLGVVDPANSASKRVLDKVGFRYWKRATIGDDEVDVYHRELDGW